MVGKIEKNIMINHVGVVYLTCLLVKMIRSEGRVINVASMTHKSISEDLINKIINDPKFEKTPSYYTFTSFYSFSKLGSVYHAQDLSEYLLKNNKQIKTCSIHPGMVKTDMLSKSLHGLKWRILLILFSPIEYFITKTAFMGAQTTIHAAYLNHGDLKSGAYFNDCN
jgi:retinol dehydrogenase-12